MFRFKQFSVDQTGCAMKINTDGVLLGALARADHPKDIFDIGTGTGVIALMLAQRFPEAGVDAVEIDPASAVTARANFQNSPFSERLTIYQTSFRQLLTDPVKKYDLVVSNPPFYINSLRSPGAERAVAKHADADFFSDLITYSARHLTETGELWLILPVSTAELVKRFAPNNHLFIQHEIQIRSYPNSTTHRLMLCLGFKQTLISETDFIIYDKQRVYSDQYKTLLQDFLIIF